MYDEVRENEFSLVTKLSTLTTCRLPTFVVGKDLLLSKFLTLSLPSPVILIRSSQYKKSLLYLVEIRSTSDCIKLFKFRFVLTINRLKVLVVCNQNLIYSVFIC